MVGIVVAVEVLVPVVVPTRHWYPLAYLPMNVAPKETLLSMDLAPHKTLLSASF